ncbi:hypothetical protein OF83DRAFT_1040987, partial [Amylostereum chailletii]
ERRTATHRTLHIQPAARRPYVEPAGRHDLGRMEVMCPHCSALLWMEERIAKSSPSDPKFGLCCNHGHVDLPDLPDPPQQLKDLYSNEDLMARDFRHYIRQYNAALAFTSVNVGDGRIHVINDGHGPYVYAIEGELHHIAGALSPPENMPPSYAQLYIHDHEAALNQRMYRNSNLHRDIMECLQTLLNDHHQYARAYRRAHEILEEQGEEEIIIRLESDPAQDTRRYNLPTANEIAAIIPGDGTEIQGRRDILLRRRAGGLRRIDNTHPAYAPLQYVLLFPYGTHGWSYNILQRVLESDKNQEPKRLSQTRYYAYRL